MKPTPKKQGKKPTKQRDLTVRQQIFAELVASGMSGKQAWLQVYPGVSGRVAESNASESLRNPKVSARVAALRKPTTKKLLYTKDMQRAELFAIGSNPATSVMARIRAIEVDAKLAGFFAPDQVVVETGPETLRDIRERAAHVVSALNRSAELRRRGDTAAAGTNGSNGHRNGNGTSNGNGNGHSNGNGNGNGHKPAGLNRWNA